ncbi:uncharacterized protein DUF4262 [Antricoccus suffuscus]|uniref:Uncharacterized protein DUF4262 n=1 Tax=Antricoccus suffuscus TaxID=1629062 RepID=A0A2T1A2Z3_9ACTN|nr:DUF4262 domain-containing protein [Antricoccus suffuscus]PRZ42698.1 uncharacterized protein DUF4262 [Antricoccus suffuscus]
MNAKDTAWLDQEDAWMRETVRKNGWAITYVGGDGCTYPGCECGDERDAEDTVFGYTVGLHGLGHPELLMYGCDPGTTSLVLNTLGRWIRGGGQPRKGVDYTIDGFGFALQFQTVPNPEEILSRHIGSTVRRKRATFRPSTCIGVPVIDTRGNLTTHCRDTHSRYPVTFRRTKTTISATSGDLLNKVIGFAGDYRPVRTPRIEVAAH